MEMLSSLLPKGSDKKLKDGFSKELAFTFMQFGSLGTTPLIICRYLERSERAASGADQRSTSCLGGFPRPALARFATRAADNFI